MALDEKDKAEIAEMLKAALSGEALKTAVAGAAGETVKAALAGLKLDEKIAAKVTELVPKPKDPPDPDPDPKTGTKVEESAEFKRMKASFDEMSKQAKQQQDRAEQAEKARQAEALTSNLRDALLANGVDPKKLPIALNHLRALGDVKLDENGAAVWKQKTTWGEDHVPVADGAKTWLGTDEGKTFLPPVGTQGTGDGAGNSGRTRQGVSAMGILAGALANLP